jgi:putative endopeptidase
VGDFYAAAMDTNRLEQLRFKPLAADLERIERVKTREGLFRLVGRFHDQGVGAMFGASVAPDPRQSSIYALSLEQGGLSLPDRDYYLKESFAPQRQAFREHVAKMFALLGEKPGAAAIHADIVLALETDLARASVTPRETHNWTTNYNKLTGAQLLKEYPGLPWQAYFSERALAGVPGAIVGQPEFFRALDKLLDARPVSDWRVYLRWQVLDASGHYLCRAAEVEGFNFYGKVLGGKPEPAPRWQYAFRALDQSIGEAMGRLYVEKFFPPQVKSRMNELVEDLKTAFRERLQKVDWMTEATRAQALAKFARLTLEIGYPDKFRDYSAIKIKRDDYLGNIRRARIFEEHRQLARIGKAVDRSEWPMTPPTVNAVGNPLNQIVFPAGMLQPPYFDLTKDDAVNYGAIGAVIGHELTHGFALEGRLFDADGNWGEWWTEQDRKGWEACAQKLVDQYNAFEALPGLQVNGEATALENLADLGSVRIAYDALQQALARDPSKRKLRDGFTPEQRFFISFAQVSRTNMRDAEARRWVAEEGHAPGCFRAVGPLVNFQEFFDAFHIKPGEPMWRAPEQRAHLW